MAWNSLKDFMGSPKCKEALDQILEARRKNDDEEARLGQPIKETEEELRDRITRTRNVTKYLLSMLPEMDIADQRRWDRASKPADDMV